MLLENIQTQVGVIADGHVALNHKFDRLERKVDGLVEDVAILKTDVAVLKTDVAILKTDVAALNKRVGRIEHHLGLNGTPKPRQPRRPTRSSGRGRS